MNSPILPVTLAASLIAGLAPAYDTMTLPHQTPPLANPAPALSDAALAQLAMDAGITVEQARHLSISQLAWLKETHDS